MKRPLRIIVQDDRPIGGRIIFLLDGITKRDGQPLAAKGFTWIRGIGAPGGWEAPNAEALRPLAHLPTFDNRTQQRVMLADYLKG